MTRVLYRVLAMQKQGTLTLALPECHPIHHLQTNRHQHYLATGMDVLFEVSKTAKALVKSDLTNMEIQDLYCQVRRLYICQFSEGTNWFQDSYE
mgnify:CR=1 FL=1